MIIEFSVKNFGSIKEKQTISFEATSGNELEEYYVIEPIPGLRLLKLGVIYGPNASGKSTILNALEFLRKLVVEAVYKKTDSLNFEPFLLDDEFINNPSLLEISFIANKRKYSYEVQFTKTHIVSEKLTYYPKNRAAEVYTRSTDPEKQISSISFGSTVKITSKDILTLEANTIWNNTLLGAIAKINIDVKELREIFEWFDEKLLPFITSKRFLIEWTTSQVENDDKMRRKVVELMRRADVQIGDLKVTNKETIVDDRMKRVLSTLREDANDVTHPVNRILQEGKVFKKEVEFSHTVNLNGKNYTRKFNQDLESNGTLQYFGLIGILTVLMESDAIGFIDEIESSLHPDLMKHLIMTFLANSLRSQLLITTHNVSFLDEKDILRNDSVWFTQKKEDGSTELYSLNDFDSSIFRKGSSLINAYKIGKLGAKPNLGSVFFTETETNA